MCQDIFLIDIMRNIVYIYLLCFLNFEYKFKPVNKMQIIVNMSLRESKLYLAKDVVGFIWSMFKLFTYIVNKCIFINITCGWNRLKFFFNNNWFEKISSLTQCFSYSVIGIIIVLVLYCCIVSINRATNKITFTHI